MCWFIHSSISWACDMCQVLKEVFGIHQWEKQMKISLIWLGEGGSINTVSKLNGILKGWYVLRKEREESEGKWWVPVIGQEGRVAILNKMVRVVFVKKVMCEWRHEGGEGICHVDNRKENIVDKGRVHAKTWEGSVRYGVSKNRKCGWRGMGKLKGRRGPRQRGEGAKLCRAPALGDTEEWLGRF